MSDRLAVLAQLIVVVLLGLFVAMCMAVAGLLSWALLTS